MIDDLKVLIVIPARGGSKGLKNKNIVDLDGKPLIYYTIEAALKSKYADRIVVSTDSQEIADVAEECDVEVPFLRPAEFAMDGSHTPPAIIHAVKYLKDAEDFSADIVVTMQVTSPFRDADVVDKMIEQLVDGKYDSVISVKNVASCHPYWAMRLDSDKLSFFNKDIESPLNIERQELPDAYFPNGSVYVTRVDALLQYGNVAIMTNCGAYIMDEVSSFDIDNEFDLSLAEFIKVSRGI